MAEQALTTEEVVETPQQEADVPRETAPEQDAAADKARKLGWKPKDEYLADGGREEKWSPPEQFLEIKERSGKERIKENQRLERKLAARDKEVDEMRRELAEIKAGMAKQNEARGEIQESALWSQREQALAAGDAGEVNRIDKALYDLRKAPAPQQQVNGNQIDPRTQAILEDFADDHPEYKRPEMQRILALSAKAVAEADPSMRGRELLDEAHDYARRHWSDRYTTTTPRRSAPMAETGGTPARTESAAKTWNDLKPESKQALDRLIATTPIYQNMKPDQVAAARARMLKDASPDMFKGGR